jgi:DNA invertase Pin-like site-specific DNA recombinase
MSHTSNGNGKATNGRLRAVGYCRTSGENQRDNTSIPNQKESITGYAKAESWNLTKFYVDEAKSGAKIAGRDAFQQMMKDAALGRFDVIVVFDTTRFGRDGFDILSSARTLKTVFGVDVLDTKGRFDTRERGRVLTNFIQAGVAEDERLRILERTKLGRIRKARELNSPLGSKRPFGRVWHWDGNKKRAGHWTIDEDKQRMVQEAARRYLAGDVIDRLGPEFGTTSAYLLHVLKHSCGPVWTQRVRCPELSIDETIETPIPELLDDATIRAVHRKALANRTYARGPLKNKYLLGRFVFCAPCGYAMSGQHMKGCKHRYYRHAHVRRLRVCKRPWPWVNADALEQVVLLYLFDCFGNPARVQKAIAEALPDQAKQDAERQRQDRLRADKAKVSAQKRRVVDGFTDGTLHGAEAKEKLAELEKREALLSDELQKLERILASALTARQVKDAAQEIVDKFRGTVERMAVQPRHKLIADHANQHIETMTWEEKRALVEMVFGGTTPEGQRCGVYIEWPDDRRGKGPKQWKFRIVGRLAFDECGTVPTEPITAGPGDFDGAPRQQELLEAVSRNAGC